MSLPNRGTISDVLLAEEWAQSQGGRIDRSIPEPVLPVRTTARTPNDTI